MRYRRGAGALCVADAGTRRRFASDLLNLTLAAPAVNRHRKSGKDAGEWLPRVSRCWLAARVVAVKRKYRLTVDACEARALEGVSLVAVRLDRDDGGRREGGGAGAGGARPGRGRSAAALGHGRQRAHHLPRGARGPDPWAAVRGPWSGSTGRASSGIESRVTATRAGPVAAR